MHKESNKKIKNDSNVTTLPSGRSFFADKRESNRCKSSEHLGKRVTDGDLYRKVFIAGNKKGEREEIMKTKEYASDVGYMSGTGKRGENRAAGDGTDEWTDACSVPTLYGLDPAGKYSEAFC